MSPPDGPWYGRKSRNAFLSAYEGGLWETANRFWQRNYAGDYLGLAIMFLAWLLLHVFMEPFHQMFRLNDPRIQHPYAQHERVPVGTWVVRILA